MLDKNTQIGLFCISDRGNTVEYLGDGNGEDTFKGRLVEVSTIGITGPPVMIGEIVDSWNRTTFSILSNINTSES